MIDFRLHWHFGTFAIHLHIKLESLAASTWRFFFTLPSEMEHFSSWNDQCVVIILFPSSPHSQYTLPQTCFILILQHCANMLLGRNSALFRALISAIFLLSSPHECISPPALPLEEIFKNGNCSSTDDTFHFKF